VKPARKDGAAEHAQLAAIGPDQADDGANEGRLAGAVGAEQRVDHAGRYAEVDAVKGGHGAEALADVACLDRSRCHGAGVHLASAKLTMRRLHSPS
jgi:hypothetical protein